MVMLPVPSPDKRGGLSIELKKQKATRKMKNNRAPGNETIPAVISKVFHKLINYISKEEQIPLRWKESVIVFLHKKMCCSIGAPNIKSYYLF